MLENAQRGSKVELLIHDGRRINLDTIKGKLLFLLSEESRGLGVIGEDPECEDGEEDRAGSLDDEEVAPVGEAAGVDLEDPEGEEAAEGGGDVGGCVENCQAAGEFASAVEYWGGLGVVDGWGRDILMAYVSGRR